jgi:hypothetical protein
VKTNQGTVLGLGTSDKGADKALAQYMRNQMDSAVYQRTLPDGTPMMDFEGKPIIGPKQLKTQLNLQKASTASSLEKMSEKERAAAIAALTKAREQDAAAAERAGSVPRMPLNAPRRGRKVRNRSWLPATRRLWIKLISSWGKWAKVQRPLCRLISRCVMSPSH